MLEGIKVVTNTDYFEAKDELGEFGKVVFTGPIDAYFDYKLGALEYRSVRFETETIDTPNFQGNAVVNYTDRETPWTRIIEHKFFEFGEQPKTVISREYSSEWKLGDEPYYPVNDEKNAALYAQYKELADAEPNVIFGGRLGEYKYYDMDKVIEAAFKCVEKEFTNMISFDKTEVMNFHNAMRGARNPLNSWNRMDSHISDEGGSVFGERLRSCKETY